MSIRAMAAAVITATAMVMAMCGTAVAATSRAASPAVQLTTVQLTGVQLLAALLPAADFPAGYKLDKSDVYDSGRHLENSPAQYHLSTMSCSSFTYNFGGTGFGETATAGDDFEKNNYTTVYLQQVYQFKTGRTAASFFRGMFAIAHRCRSFVLSGVSGILTHVFDASPVGGHRTFQVNQSGTLQGILVGVDSVITVAGTDVFYVGSLGVGFAPPSNPSGRTTMLRLIRRVEAYR
jgi:hypothetical protein